MEKRKFVLSLEVNVDQRGGGDTYSCGKCCEELQLRLKSCCIERFHEGSEPGQAGFFDPLVRCHS